MITKVRLCANHRRRVSIGGELTFGPGITSLVGPNGTGKSTILRAVASCDDCRIERTNQAPTVHFHAGFSNPQASDFVRKGYLDMVLQTRSLFSSHGQIMRDVLATLPFEQGSTLLLDEPESGQDLGWVERIRGGLADLCEEIDLQVIMATHHPLLWHDTRLMELAEGYAREVESRFLERLAKG